MLLAAGGVFFLAFVHDAREDERRLATTLIVAFAILAVVARVAAEPVRTILLTGQGLSAITDPPAYDVTLRTSDGWSGVVRLVGLAILMIGVVQRKRWGLIVASIGGVIALLSATMAGHTVTGQPQWLVRGSDFAHVLAAAAWFGGLVLLGLILRRRWGGPEPLDGAGMVARFSGLAVVSLAAVLAAGVAMSWAEIRTFDALFDSTYGTVLLIKIGLVVVVVALGAYNNRWLVPAIRRSAADAGEAVDHQVWRRLGTTVRIEAVVLVVVLAVTGVLVHVAPPRPQEDTMHEPDHASATIDGDPASDTPVPS